MIAYILAFTFVAAPVGASFGTIALEIFEDHKHGARIAVAVSLVVAISFSILAL